MNGSSLRKREGIPFSYTLLLAIIFTVSLAIAGITYFSYLNVQSELEGGARVLRVQSEHMLVSSFQIKDAGLRLYDDTMNKRMETAFEPFIAEYERSGRNPVEMDLEGLKEALGEEMEFYVISADAVIEYTTYLPDQGLDFKQFTSYFPAYLKEIRESGGFFPDRVVSEVTTGNLKKFAYMATPDHRYVLEIGLSAEIFQDERAGFYMSDEQIIHEAMDRNPVISQIRIFDTSLREKREAISYPVEDVVLRETLATILSERQGTEQMDPVTGTITQYLFIDLWDPRYGTDPSLILELTYSRASIDRSLQEVLFSHLGVAVVAILLSSLLALLLSRHLTRPIETIVSDVRKISDGDLDHAVGGTKGKELSMLADGINAMLTRLRTTIYQFQENERRLELSEQKYRAVVESQKEFITRFHPDGTHIFANEAYCQYFDQPCESIIGTRFRPSYPPEDRERLETHFASLTPQNPEATIEHRIIMPSGEIRWQHWSDRAIIDQDGKIIEYQSVGRDITGRKKAEEDLKRLYGELEQRVKDRTEELESFSYSVSHDLRAPLRAIDGYASILLEEYASSLSPEAITYLQKVSANTRHMAQLIDELLTFSRMGRLPLEKKEVNPAEIVHTALEQFHADLEKRDVEIRIERLPLCKADPSMLTLVYQNLLSNALKFTRSREKAIIEISSYQKEGGTVYYVRDNGIGFDMQFVKNLFGVFQRLHRSPEYEGTGVGLAIVQRIIERHGGTVWAEGKVNGGATIYFTLEVRA
jgi:PAS domain S-box-containing protein